MHPNRRLAGASAAVLAAGVLLAGSVGEAAAQVTAEQARAAALARVPGTVLELETERTGGRLAYEVEVRPANGGPVVEVLVDASNAAVLSTAGDDGDGPGDVDGPGDDD